MKWFSNVFQMFPTSNWARSQWILLFYSASERHPADGHTIQWPSCWGDSYNQNGSSSARCVAWRRSSSWKHMKTMTPKVLSIDFYITSNVDNMDEYGWIMMNMVDCGMIMDDYGWLSYAIFSCSHRQSILWNKNRAAPDVKVSLTGLGRTMTWDIGPVTPHW